MTKLKRKVETNKGVVLRIDGQGILFLHFYATSFVIHSTSARWERENNNVFLLWAGRKAAPAAATGRGWPKRIQFPWQKGLGKCNQKVDAKAPSCSQFLIFPSFYFLFFFREAFFFLPERRPGRSPGRRHTQQALRQTSLSCCVFRVPNRFLIIFCII